MSFNPSQSQLTNIQKLTSGQPVSDVRADSTKLMSEKLNTKMRIKIPPSESFESRARCATTSLFICI